MNEYVLYLVRSACWLTGFALVFLLFLRNERFFILKRVFLIAGILASFIFPFISFHYPVEIATPATIAFNSGPEILPDSSIITQQLPQTGRFDLMNVILFVYVFGLLVFASRMIFHIFLKFRIIKKHNNLNKNTTNIIRSSEYPSSFSFFNYIFINPSVEENEFREIMNHELVHVNQKHWLDLLLVEILSLFQWANPFAWIYTGFIRLNHEFIADEVALKRSSDPTIYKAALLNHIFRAPVISLSNSFNYSINKNRFEMMKKIVTSPYRKLKVLFILPVFALLFYAFAEPEYLYSDPGMEGSGAVAITIKEVKGIVLKQDGQPFKGVQIAVTGTEIRGATDVSGKFTLIDVPEEAHIVFSYRGHITQVLKPISSGSMTVKLLKDPEFVGIPVPASILDGLVIIDGVISNNPKESLSAMDRDQIAKMAVLPEKDAVAKYGEKGKKGVLEIVTKEKASEFGIKVPYQRQVPEDYPTFMGENYAKFGKWLAGKLKYPAEAAAKGINGRVSVNFVVQPDGSIGTVTLTGSPDKTLGEEVVKAIKESPRWEPAKNPDARDPFNTTATLKFELPDKITPDDVYIVVEQMPEYPGGSVSLLEVIKQNVRYPDGAKADKAEGRVIVRFVVNTKGVVEDAAILKGVHPLLDAEALRVVNNLTGWLPGAQGGKPVNVWYMVPVSFVLQTQLQPNKLK